MAQTSEPERFRLGYRPELDGLRALAVALVFIAHISYPWQSLKGFMPGTFQGVDLFFVLSGFLLTKLLLEERAATGGFSFRGFYRRRALRLLPALVFMLAVLLAYMALDGEALHKTLVSDLWVILYVSNWATVIGHPGTITFPLSHMWSLAIEEQYYLIFFPLLIVLLHAFKSLRTILWVLIGMIVAVWVARGVVAAGTTGGFETSVYVRTDLRADALLLGPVVAVLLEMGHRITPRIRLLGIPAVAFLVWTILYAHVEDRWFYVWAMAVAEVCWTLVMVSVLAARHPFARLLRLRPVVWMGKISYGLYLWHLPIFVETLRHMRYRNVPHWLPFAIAVVLSFAAATFSYYVVERPFLRRKRPRGSSVIPREPSVVTAAG